MALATVCPWDVLITGWGRTMGGSGSSMPRVKSLSLQLNGLVSCVSKCNGQWVHLIAINHTYEYGYLLLFVCLSLAVKAKTPLSLF